MYQKSWTSSFYRLLQTKKPSFGRSYVQDCVNSRKCLSTTSGLPWLRPLLPRSGPRNTCSTRCHASLAKTVPDTIGQRSSSERPNEGNVQQQQQSDAGRRQEVAAAAAAASQIDVKPPEDTRTQRQRDIAIIKQLLPNVWPKGDSSTKTRVILAVSLLVAGKVSNMQYTHPRYRC